MTKAIGRNGLPEIINIDKSGANAAAIVSYNNEHDTKIYIRVSRKYMYVKIMQQDALCKSKIEIHVSRILRRCIYVDSHSSPKFKGSDSCVLAQMYLPVSKSGSSMSSSTSR